MTTIQDVISRLRQPVASLDELDALLAAPLVSLGVPVPRYSGSLSLPTPSTRQLGTLQSTILTHVYPVWEEHTSLCDIFFVPPKSSIYPASSDGARALVLNSLALLTTPPLSRFSIRLLEKLILNYQLDDIWEICAHEENESIIWDRALSSWMSVPGKVANALLGSGTNSSQEVPDVLSFDEHAVQTCLATERVVWGVAIQPKQEMSEEEVEKLTHLISKLISTGHFSESTSSFIPLSLPHIRTRIVSSHAEGYSDLWSRIIKNLPGPQLQKFATSLLNHLDNGQTRSSDITPFRLHPSKALGVFFGPASRAATEMWQTIIGSGRTWGRGLVRGIVGWAAGLGAKREPLDEQGLALLLEHILAVWSDPQHVARALLNEHRYLTSLLVLVLGALSNPASTPWSTAPQSSLDLFEESVADLNDLDPLEPSKSTAPSVPQVHPLVTSTSTSPAFIRAVGAYLSQRDEAVRRCGMLVAEIVAGGRLNFEDWEGEKEWQKWAAELRTESKDVLETIQKEIENMDTSQELNEPNAVESDQTAPPKEPPVTHTMDTLMGDHRTPPEPDSDDDSLVGYDSPSPTSTRSPSPTPSELADPTLRRKPIPRPVYLAELGALLVEAPKNAVEVQPSEHFGGGGKKVRRGMGITGGRGGGDAEDERGRVEMALGIGAELVRRKRGYGTELDENAINLVHLFISLQDNFDLDEFEEKRQDVLVALVVCCPTKAAPTIIEQFFHHQYSTAQRFTMLNALALGARELAGLPVPPSRIAPSEKRLRIDFPSKVLPGPAHLQYLTDGDLPPVSTNQLTSNQRRIEGMRSQVSALVEDLSGQAITRSKQDTEARVPQAVRERALKLGPRPGRSIVPLDSSSSAPSAPAALGYLPSQTPVIPFSQVAAESFVAPLINRFWAHLRGSLEREAYVNAARTASGVRTGTGTGLILSPLVLAHLLGTMSVLLHASRHSPAFLHILGPDAAELALTVGSRPLSHVKQVSPEVPDGEGTEAGVLAGALELALTVLDAAIELDGGRVFATERAELLIGVGEWASAIFEALDKGERVPGRGGTEEEKAVRIAAGVVLTAERIIGRWRRSMVMM